VRFLVLVPVLLGKMSHEAVADELLGLLAEVPAVGFVDEGEGRVGQEAADQLCLLLDHRPVALLALL
jgi:hypothetical protein